MCCLIYGSLAVNQWPRNNTTTSHFNLAVSACVCFKGMVDSFCRVALKSVFLSVDLLCFPVYMWVLVFVSKRLHVTVCTDL